LGSASSIGNSFTAFSSSSSFLTTLGLQMTKKRPTMCETVVWEDLISHLYISISTDPFSDPIIEPTEL
jgi:hypothetical protein